MKILRTDEYIDLVAKLEMYKEMLRVERIFAEKQEKKIEKMKCGGNCKHSYYVNTGDCYDMKCRQTYCDCINCSDKWELADE